MRRRTRVILGVCLGLIACACALVWLFTPRAITLRGHTGAVRRVTASPNGRTLASFADDGTIRLWDIASRKELATLRGHPGTAESWHLAFSPDGKTLASADDKSGEIRVWDLTTGGEMAPLIGHRGGVRCLAFSPDGGVLASGGSDRQLRLWDVAGRKALAVLEDTGSVDSVAFCNNGKLLASAGALEGSIDLWDVGGRRLQAVLPGYPPQRIVHLAASPCGTTLASGDLFGKVRLWDAATGEEKILEASLLEHKSISNLALSPDGKTLAAVYQGNEIDFWDVTTGKNTASWQPPSSQSRSAPSRPNRLLLDIRPNIARMYSGLGVEETGTAYGVLFNSTGNVFAAGRDDHDRTLVKMWEIQPLPWRR